MEHARLGSSNDRAARLEEVRAAFLATYSHTLGLRSAAPSPVGTGGIGSLLEQLARGVGLRGSGSSSTL
ncbi:hypothetical protein Y1Q_0016077 [Alligator mississippiensis]|uniref:Uncharacterized protein n=1 Tax=Alligator mississippiensis TaxID=8496 RepID=A0A151P4X9_ALLMI|nr:hypothetical protein Y1Q_0016077 [Alligator mississippiensis]